MKITIIKSSCKDWIIILILSVCAYLVINHLPSAANGLVSFVVGMIASMYFIEYREIENEK